jgi:hypothetical protein
VDDAEERREAIYRLFGESRFGFRHALEIWPESETARDGLQRAIEMMVEFELAQSEPEAAKTLLTEMPKVPVELAERVEAARKERAEEDAALRKIQDEHDPSAGRRTRMFVSLILGTIWGISPLMIELAIQMEWMTEQTHVYPVAFESVFLAFAVGLGIWARESMMRTRMNRVIAVSGVLAMLTQLLMHAFEYMAGGTDVLVTLRYEFMVWAAISGMLAVAVDWRLLIPAIGFVIGFAVLAFWPRAVFITMSICNELLFIVMMIAWFRKEDLDVVIEGSRARRARRRERRRERLGNAPPEPESTS